MRGPQRRPLEERFWAKVNRGTQDECWLWTACTCAQMGYGYIGIGGRAAGNIMAHRLSYEMHKGSIPDGMLVCHSCDNPRCVNPDHLFLGTRLDNQGDMSRKGRSPRGERQGRAKLTDRAVREIRNSYGPGMSMKCLADAHGVCAQSICNVINRVTWSHIQ